MCNEIKCAIQSTVDLINITCIYNCFSQTAKCNKEANPHGVVCPLECA